MANLTFKIKKELTERPVKLLYVTHSKYDAVEWHSKLHSHHFTELFYIKSGSGRFIFEDRSEPISAGDFVIINPNVLHTEISSEENLLEYIAVGFEGFSFNQTTENKNRSSVFIHSNEHDLTTSLLDTMVEECQNKNKHYEIYCQNLLEVLLIYLIRQGEYTLKETKGKQINEHIFAVKIHLEEHFKEDLTLEELSEVSHMSKYYMAHTFKEAFGISPIEYLNNIRINEACILLETTNFSIAEISDFIGFSSQSYFSQSFKTKLKITPSKYRSVKKEKITNK